MSHGGQYHTRLNPQQQTSCNPALAQSHALVHVYAGGVNVCSFKRRTHAVVANATNHSVARSRNMPSFCDGSVKTPRIYYTTNDARSMRLFSDRVWAAKVYKVG